MSHVAAVRRTGTFWAFFPAMILVPLISVQLYLVHRALSDPSFAVEDRYYAKAVAWDTTVAERRENERLGWRTTLTVVASSNRAQRVSLTLRDHSGTSVTGSHVAVDAFAIARSSRVTHLPLSEVAPGVYEGVLTPEREGLWQLSFQATRGRDHFTSIERRDLTEERP